MAREHIIAAGDGRVGGRLEVKKRNVCLFADHGLKNIQFWQNWQCKKNELKTLWMTLVTENTYRSYISAYKWLKIQRNLQREGLLSFGRPECSIYTFMKAELQKGKYQRLLPVMICKQGSLWRQIFFGGEGMGTNTVAITHQFKRECLEWRAKWDIDWWLRTSTSKHWLETFKWTNCTKQTHRETIGGHTDSQHIFFLWEVNWTLSSYWIRAASREFRLAPQEVKQDQIVAF